MPRSTAAEPFVTEPGRAVVLHEAVFPLHHTLLPDRPLGHLHGERLPPVALNGIRLRSNKTSPFSLSRVTD